MGHELRPRSGGAPNARDVEHRLQAEFAFLSVDAAEETRRARALADWIEAQPASIFLGQHAAWLERAKMLRALPPGEAVVITCGDSAADAVSFALIPGDVIKFGYRDAEDEARRRALVERCARALDSDTIAF